MQRISTRAHAEPDQAITATLWAAYSDMPAAKIIELLVDRPSVLAALELEIREATAVALSLKALSVLRAILESDRTDAQFSRLRLEAAKVALDLAGHVGAAACEQG